ncbi:unnamed protein product, partial [Nesidiocoris tenuis]
TIAASSNMPEQAEVEQKPVEVDSGTDSENDDMPELEPTGKNVLACICSSMST